jgi:hypothetical protein
MEFPDSIVRAADLIKARYQAEYESIEIEKGLGGKRWTIVTNILTSNDDVVRIKITPLENGDYQLSEAYQYSGEFVSALLDYLSEEQIAIYLTRLSHYWGVCLEDSNFGVIAPNNPTEFSTQYSLLLSFLTEVVTGTVLLNMINDLKKEEQEDE